MPLVKTVKGQAQVLGGVNLLERPAIVKDSSFSELWGVAWDTETITGSLTSAFNAGNGIEYEEVPEYSVFDDIVGYEDYTISFQDVRSPEHASAIKEKIDREIENRQLLMNAGGKGLAASVLAQFLDPIGIGLMFVPGGQAVKGAKFAKTVGMFAGAGMVASFATEAVLLNTQEIRTLKEAAIDITATTFLSGLLGAGAAGLGRAGMKDLAGRTSADFNKNSVPSSMPADFIDPRHAGAAQVITTTLEQETLVSSKKAVEAMAWVTPVARVMHKAKTVEARRVMQGLAENAFYTEKNVAGIATENAVESFIKVRRNSATFEVVTATKDSFKAYSKRTHGDPSALSESQFREEVGKALRRSETSLIPEVVETAKVYRKQFDLLKDDAIEFGLLPEDVTPAGAESYFSRIYSPEIIKDNMAEFTEIVTGHLQQGANKAVKGHAKAVRDIQAKLDTLDDLTSGVNASKLSKPELLDTLDQLQAVVPNLSVVIGKKALKGDLKKAVIDALEKAAKQNNKLLAAREKANSLVDLAQEGDFEGMARETIENILGNGGRFDFSQLPEDVIGKAGAFKERTLNIDDLLIEKFLVDDAEYVFNVHSRQVIPQIELARKFGRVDLKDQIQEVRDSYKSLLAKAKTAKERKPIEKNMNDAIKDITAVRDILLGTFKQPVDPQSIVSRAGRSLRDLNFITMLGGMTLSAIPDLARHIMVNGWSRNFKTLAVVFKNFSALKIAKQDLQKMGVAVDMVTASRANAIADIEDLIHRKSGVERGLKWSTDKMGLVTGMNYWNDTMKAFAGFNVQDRILTGALAAKAGTLSKSELRKLAQLGFDDLKLKDIADQFNQHGENVDGLLMSKAHNWTNAELRRDFEASITKEVDSIIVTPGAGDKPLMFRGDIGKTIGQFKSFMFASGNRAVIAGFQQNDFAAYSGMATMIALGSFTYVIKELIKGREPDLSIERLVREGFDRSGLLGVLGEINGVTERLSRGNIGLSALTGGASLSRFQQRNILGSLMGPSFGKAEDLFRIGGAALTGEFDKGTVKAAQRMIPFNNLFYIQGLLNATGAQKAIEKELVTK